MGKTSENQQNAQVGIIPVSMQEWNETNARINRICDFIENEGVKKQPELLTINQVCEILKIQRATFYRYKNNGLKVSVVGKKSFVYRTDLEDFLAKGNV